MAVMWRGLWQASTWGRTYSPGFVRISKYDWHAEEAEQPCKEGWHGGRSATFLRSPSTEHDNTPRIRIGKQALVVDMLCTGAVSSQPGCQSTTAWVV